MVVVAIVFIAYIFDSVRILPNCIGIFAKSMLEPDVSL